MTKDDGNQVLRKLPLVVGILAGSLLMLNRLLTPDITESQARSDALGILMSALLILTGLLWQNIQARSPDTVELIGTEGFDLNPDLPEPVKMELAWASHLLLTNTVTRIVLVCYNGKVLLRRGILPEKKSVEPGPIIKRVLETQKAVYLVDLKLYPGRIEFDYLPSNTQGVICQNLGEKGVLILGANAPRSYTKQDENWIKGIAEKLGITIESYQ